ncbi:hypothetical protein DYB32_001233 [Aphanomyces invadans]|uniref:J domain-containing protein n=1 Tax=Aphanomyces invadans TaxID=157072 RepID=A0A3R6YF70_9STRA|nr:hypothetical protein DYB32_001233 [Aphanomyces invadans]
MSMHLSVMRCWVCLVEFVAAVDRVVYCVGCSIARNMCSLNACTHPLATIRRVAKAASTSAKPKGRPQACPVPPPPPPQWVGLKKKGGEAYSNGDFVLSIDLYSSALEDLDRQLLKAPCADLRAEKAKVLSNRAAAFMMIDKIQEALQDCVAAIDCDGSYLRAHLRLAKCHLLVGNTKSARASYRQVDVMLRGMDYRHHPHLQNYHTQWHEGHLATRLLESLNRQTKRHEDGKDLKAALRTTEEAMAIALASRELRVRKMKLLVQLRYSSSFTAPQMLTWPMCSAYDLAEDFCNALVRNGALSGVHALGIEMAVLYVRALHYHDKTNEANAILQQLLKVAPTSVDILNVKNLWEVMTDLRSAANSAFKGGDYTSAVLLYTKALTLDVDNHTYNATILGNRAAAHMALKLHAKAIEDCNLALGHHPMYYKVLLRRARCFYTLKHYKESLADFDEYMAKAALTPIEQKDIGRERDQVKNDWDKARRPPSPNYSQSWDDFDDFDTYHSYSAFGGYRQHDNQRSDRSRQNKPKVHKSRQQQYGHHSNYQRSHAKPPTPRYVSPGPTHYDVLRVTATATLDEIKKSYRKLALMYHPDKAKSVEDGELFKGMSAAYAVLSDVHLKAAYDKELRYGSY